MANPVVRRIPVRYAQIFADVIRGLGVDIQPMMEAAGVSAERIADRRAMITQPEFDAFIHAAAKATGRQDLGFEVGRRVKMNSHDMLGYGIMSAETLDQLFRMASRHYHLMLETWSMSYRRAAESGEVVYTPAIAMPAESLRFYLEALTMAHVNQIELLLGDKSLPYDIYLSMPEPAHVSRYLALAPVHFHFSKGGLPGLRVVMPVKMLDTRLPLGEPEVVREIDERCSALAQRPDRGTASWVDYITMVLRDCNGQQVTLDELAKRLNVSARTIDRHLKQEGLGFRQLSDKVRFEIACKALSIEGAKLANIAQQLGFCDTASFSHAFKRVVGVSPREYVLKLSSAQM